MEEDAELEEIRRRKLMELAEKSQQQWPSKPVQVTDQDFDQIAHKYPMVVVDCWAPWCMPCHMIAPAIEELAKTWSGKVVFGKLNTDENPDTAMRFRIMSIPTLLFVKNGQVVDRMVGAAPKEYIEAKIREHLGA